MDNNIFNEKPKAAVMDTPASAENIYFNDSKPDLHLGKYDHFKYEMNAKHKGEDKGEFSLETILKRIDNIITADSYLKDAINSIKDMQMSEGYDSQILITKIETITRIVQQREDTNRRAIDFLERMFDGLRPEKNDFQIKKMEMIEKIILNNEISDEARNTAFDMLRDI